MAMRTLLRAVVQLGAGENECVCKVELPGAEYIMTKSARGTKDAGTGAKKRGVESIIDEDGSTSGPELCSAGGCKKKSSDGKTSSDLGVRFTS